MNGTREHKSTNAVLHILLAYLTVFLIFALLSTLASRLFYPSGFDLEIDKNAFSYEYTGIIPLLADSFSASLFELAVLVFLLFSTLTLIPKQICVCVFALRGFASASVICKFITENSLADNAPAIFAMVIASVLCACYGAFTTYFSTEAKYKAVPFAFLRAALFFPIFAGAICAVSAIKLYLLS